MSTAHSTRCAISARTRRGRSARAASAAGSSPTRRRPLRIRNLDLVRDGEIIRCPWHLWEFDILTGGCLVDPKVRVKTYPVRIEDGEVVVYADPAELPAQPSGTPVDGVGGEGAPARMHTS